MNLGFLWRIDPLTLLGAAVCSLLVGPAIADRTITAGYHDDDTWLEGETITLAGSVYYQKLTIEPGVTVKVSTTYTQTGVDQVTHATINISSSIHAVGTREKPILFTADGAGSWGWVQVRGAYQVPSEFTHVVVEKGQSGIEFTGDHIRVTNTIVRDIKGANGINGCSVDTGLCYIAGSPGRDTYGIKVSVSGNSSVEVRDIRIERIQGGNGGFGGFLASSNYGGDGGQGGTAQGLAVLASVLPDFTVENISIEGIYGGDGGDPGYDFDNTGSLRAPGGAIGLDVAAVETLAGPQIVELTNIAISQVAAGRSCFINLGGTPEQSQGAYSEGIRLVANVQATIRHATITNIWDRGCGPDNLAVRGAIGIRYPTTIKPDTGVTLYSSYIGNLRAEGGPVEFPPPYLVAIQCDAGMYAGDYNALPGDGTAFSNAANVGGAHDAVIADPGFVQGDASSPTDPTDLHLTETSALIGLAQPGGGAFDLENWTRDNAPDIGATEYHPTGGRYSGDFDGDTCSTISDFLILLDGWGMSFQGGPELGLGDFLALLDNWQTCS